MCLKKWIVVDVSASDPGSSFSTEALITLAAGILLVYSSYLNPFPQLSLNCEKLLHPKSFLLSKGSL